MAIVHLPNILLGKIYPLNDSSISATFVVLIVCQYRRRRIV